MLQNKFEMPLDLAVNNSKIFCFYLFFIIFFSVISVFISSLLLSVKLLLLAALVIFVIFTIKRQKMNKVTSITLSGSDEWKIEINNNQIYDAELQGECIVTYFLIWLNFKTYNSFGLKKEFHTLLLPDSVDKDLLRKLRVRLRFLLSTDKNKVEGLTQD